MTETNERRFDEPLAALIAERGIVVCPTTNVNAPYVAELTGIVIGEYLAAMRDMGVRVIAGGRDYVPDGGRFDVSAPGTPFASPIARSASTC